MTKPISPEYIDTMNRIAKVLGPAFAPSAFVLLAFKAGTDQVNYISSGPREEMIAAMKACIARLENGEPTGPVH
jgi:hypothetical protein